MDPNSGLFGWSFSIGTWFSTRVRISFLTPVLALILMYRLEMRPGLIATILTLASLLAHEFAHIFAARASGGDGNEIVLSPFGGVAMVHPANTSLSRLVIPASGPLINLAICVGLMPVLYSQNQDLMRLMNVFTYNELNLPENAAQLVCQLAFVINWLLLWINLIPVHPLDGGRILQVILTETWGSEVSNRVYLRVGIIFGVVFLVGGMMFDVTMVVALGAFVLLLNMDETYRMRTTDAYDDSFMGYDFSQGYTSLEREEYDSDEPAESRPGLIARWKQARQEKREEEERVRTEEDARQLDGILARLHEVGYDALTNAEKRVLDRASDRFKNRQDETS